MTSPIAIVVGAGGGLGQATAVTLHSAGYTTIGVDRNESGLGALPPAIRREVADATDPTVSKPLIDRIASEVGVPDVLVNTIGAYELGQSLTVTPETFTLMLEVNVGAALWLTQAVAPHMQQVGSGVIVHVGARQGLEPSVGTAAYSMSKAALVHLVRILDLEYRPHGIRVNAILPQVIATEKNKALLPPEFLSDAVEPEALARVIEFLVGDQSGPVSGAVVPTYGGSA
jgi:NAD(P)-dependent dehydrogenase (short-subunit alcohol dehydrogenase family)